MANDVLPADAARLGKHPKGLYVLFSQKCGSDLVII